MHEKEISDKQPYALHMQGLTVHMGPSFLPRYMVLHCVSVVHKKEKNSFFFWSTNSCLKVDAFLRKQTTVAHKHIRQMFCAFMH